MTEQLYEVFANPAEAGKRSIDVFPPIPGATVNFAYSMLSKYFSNMTEDTTDAMLLHPVNIDDEIYGAGHRIWVEGVESETVIAGLTNRLVQLLNVATDPATDVYEGSVRRVAEQIKLNRRYL